MSIYDWSLVSKEVGAMATDKNGTTYMYQFKEGVKVTKSLFIRGSYYWDVAAVGSIPPVKEFPGPVPDVPWKESLELRPGPDPDPAPTRWACQDISWGMKGPHGEEPEMVSLMFPQSAGYPTSEESHDSGEVTVGVVLTYVGNTWGWHLVCHALFKDMVRLKATSLEEAKAEALKRITAHLRHLLAEVEKVGE